MVVTLMLERCSHRVWSPRYMRFRHEEDAPWTARRRTCRCQEKQRNAAARAVARRPHGPPPGWSPWTRPRGGGRALTDPPPPPARRAARSPARTRPRTRRPRATGLRPAWEATPRRPSPSTVEWLEGELPGWVVSSCAAAGLNAHRARLRAGAGRVMSSSRWAARFLFRTFTLSHPPYQSSHTAQLRAGPPGVARWLFASQQLCG